MCSLCLLAMGNGEEGSKIRRWSGTEEKTTPVGYRSLIE